MSLLINPMQNSWKTMPIQLPYHRFDDFHSASNAVLKFLHDRLGFGLWMVTRTEGQEWIVLNAADYYYGVGPGDVFQWMDSYCSKMIRGYGPRIAPRSAEVPAYAVAPIGEQVPIAAYIGVPIARPDGSLFGTLCAIDPEPQPERIKHEQPLIELLAGMLATILEKEQISLAEARRAEQASSEAMTDALTGLFNRRGWDRLVEAEECRCQRYGHPVCMFSVDVDGLKEINDQLGHAEGDELLKKVSRSLRMIVRESDVVARLGGDEFGVLAVECDLQDAETIKSRLQSLLEPCSISVSVGFSIRSAKNSLTETMQIADKNMYREKRQHHSIGCPTDNPCR